MGLAYLPLCAAAALAGGSSGSGGQRVAQAPAPPDWRSIATDSARHRLRAWRTAWVRGLEKARASGHGAALAPEGALLPPHPPNSWEYPPPGLYLCPTLQCGGPWEATLDTLADPGSDGPTGHETGQNEYTK